MLPHNGIYVLYVKLIFTMVLKFHCFQLSFMLFTFLRRFFSQVLHLYVLTQNSILNVMNLSEPNFGRLFWDDDTV